MKKACLVLMVLFLVLVMVACKSSPSSAPSGAVALPDWINDIEPDDVFWGIGTAKQSSTSLSMTTAEARARVAVARTLNNRVQAMFTDYNLDAGNVNNQANASMQEDVSRQISNINLSGARINQRWAAPDGTFWIRVEYNKSDAKNAMSSILGNQEAAFAQFKAQQALAILDAQLAKSEPVMRVDND